MKFSDHCPSDATADLSLTLAIKHYQEKNGLTFQTKTD